VSLLGSCDLWARERSSLSQEWEEFQAFLTLTCLNVPLRDNIPNNSEGRGAVHLQYLLQADM
jgi:hypothetical protein